MRGIRIRGASQQPEWSDPLQVRVEAVRGAGGVPGGLHLETTPDDVTECATTEADPGHVGERYTSHCDPRLNPWQARAVVSSWAA
ncbi:hypothetical protein GCM10010279_68550 [Streptomyces mutabilis]|nr:hypothetical protein GCM10010279_68550 [Streptomyces mutabilis]